ncbi:hypothetical protein EVAR_40177_1 [Eumeta japonica]|uniref:Uncharacterized protein n=1 Tax=Eumeta variegata TaxID=151549 RepID=A0A4C1XJ34_EUMVA|nr:hypothetical protein EVAR_40177_1 [Eumeta japonica]
MILGYPWTTVSCHLLHGFGIATQENFFISSRIMRTGRSHSSRTDEHSTQPADSMNYVFQAWLFYEFSDIKLEANLDHEIINHVLWISHHCFVAYHGISLGLKNSPVKRTRMLEEYAPAYLTLICFVSVFRSILRTERVCEPQVGHHRRPWTLAAIEESLQTGYLALALACDAAQWKGSVDAVLFGKLKYWRDVIFNGLIVPNSMKISKRDPCRRFKHMHSLHRFVLHEKILNKNSVERYRHPRKEAGWRTPEHTKTPVSGRIPDRYSECQRALGKSDGLGARAP